MKIGILGAGWIARKMAMTLQDTPEMKWAVSSRDYAKARAFADEFGFARAYGSYEEMVCDPEVDLVYVATPHSHHFQHASLAVNHGKAVLCEKAFTANSREAEALIRLAEEKGVFITEAIWTRYMPLSLKIREILDSRLLGSPKMLSASIGYSMADKERIIKPELCGGALLDITIYAINFARMYFGTDIVKTVSHAVLGPSGTDMQESISLLYQDGRVANLMATALAANDNHGVISCEKGFLVVDNINNPSVVTAYANDRSVVGTWYSEGKKSGYEYQIYACEEALRNGWTESPYMPHKETIAIMKQMDSLREEWGVRFPMD